MRDITTLYSDSMQFIQAALQRDPLRSYTRVRLISPEQRPTPRLRDFWLDFTEDAIYFHMDLTSITNTAIMQTFCHFAAFTAFFPLEYWKNEVIFSGIWLWHMSKWLANPRISPIIMAILTRFSAYMDHTALHKNALTLLAFIDVDRLYGMIGSHLLPYLNPHLPEITIVRLFSQITMYLIARSLHLQDMITICNQTDSSLIFGKRYMINYPKCGLQYLYGILVWNARSKELLHRQVRKYLGSLFFIGNLNICQSVITFYALLPPDRRQELETYFKQLKIAHYVKFWSLTPVQLEKNIQYDRAVSPSIKITSLQEFSSQRLFTLRSSLVHPPEMRLIFHSESPQEITQASLDEIRITLLYDILQASVPSDGDLAPIYSLYTQLLSTPLPFPQFTELWGSVVRKKMIKADPASLIFAIRQAPTTLTIGMWFSQSPTFLSSYMALYAALTAISPIHAGHGMIFTVSTFFFPFWCKQCYQYGSAFSLFDIEYLKPTDHITFVSHIADLFTSTSLPVPESIPENCEENLLFPSTGCDTPLLMPSKFPSPEEIFPDFLTLRRVYFVHDSLYGFSLMQQDKLAHLFTTLFSLYFDPKTRFHRIDTSLVSDVKQALSQLKIRRSHDNKLFLQLCTPFHRIFPSLLHNMRIQVILTAHGQLNPILCADHPFLQGIFQWGVLSCLYQTTATWSIVILEYDLPRTIYENQKSDFNRFWKECHRQFRSDIHIEMLPIDACWYACNLPVFTSHNLLSLSLVNLRKIDECEGYPNPYLYYYDYTRLPLHLEGIPFSIDSSSDSISNLTTHAIWGREWFSSSFFLATQATLRVVFLLSKDDPWNRQKDRLLLFFQQFPGMWINDTQRFWIICIDLGGLVREALAFITAQLLSNHLNYEICFPIELSYNPPELLRDFLGLSRQSYHCRTMNRDIIEEPLFCYHSRHDLYPLIFRAQIHRLFVEFMRLYQNKVTSSLWGLILSIIDRYYQQWKETGECQEEQFKSDMDAVFR